MVTGSVFIGFTCAWYLHNRGSAPAASGFVTKSWQPRTIPQTSLSSRDPKPSDRT